ncbi:ABC-F family ATP-binding cassette domain-containing protein [Kocuria coralli]|uniref:ABC-F family ATP-binding cassette domain-containing protein n=1 Tax=Kocuria coralli TaxID=1461025 RepID=A0A5J5KZ45_9MICC|nr:ABC-F family ATP-binding cassette domain-containing protein [Kocuria coralli]
MVLDGVNVTIAQGTRLAVVGENGRGKTSLLHALAGVLSAGSGSVTRAGTVGLSQQVLEAGNDETVGTVIAAATRASREALRALDETAEQLARGNPAAEGLYADALEACNRLEAWDTERQVDMALQGLNACRDRSTPLGSLSVGQRYRVQLACLMAGDYETLLLDEPTNHLDSAALEFLADSLRHRRGGFAVVTHDRRLLREVARTFLDLDPSADGRPQLYSGGYEGWQEAKRAARAQWVQAYEAQQAEHRRLADAVVEAQDRLSTGWRPEKGHGKHQRQSRAPGVVQALRRRQAELEAHRITVPEPPVQLAWPELTTRRGLPIISARGITREDRTRSSVDLSISGGDRLLVTGPNGAGKSTLMAMLARDLEPSTGEVGHLSGARVTHLSQEVPRWDPRQTAQEAFTAHVQRLVVHGRLREKERISLTALGLLDSRARAAPIGGLSQGQRRRLHLAMGLAERPDLLILDEPTNHLSANLVDELTQGLLTTPAAVVVATHDRQMLADLAAWDRLELG